MKLLVISVKKLTRFVFHFFIILTIAIIIRIFFFEIYKIPSPSMASTLLPGDIIAINKITYGARLIKIRKFFEEGKIEYKRMLGCSPIKKGDVFVFNWPNYYGMMKSQNLIYGDFVIKRCYGSPGDTILIDVKQKNYLKNSVPLKINVLFPHDSTFKWTLNHYGPLYVPGRNTKIKINYKNIKLYGSIIKFENPNSKIKDSILWINEKKVNEYKFLNNYYFMLGDNFYDSYDSRFWGFVPEQNVIGKAQMIIFSVDSNKPWFSANRWDRIFKIIN